MCCVGFRPRTNSFFLLSFRWWIPKSTLRVGRAFFWPRRTAETGLCRRLCFISTPFPLQISPAFSEPPPFPAPPQTCSESAPLIKRHETITGELSRPQQWDGGAPVPLGSLLPSLPPPHPRAAGPGLPLWPSAAARQLECSKNHKRSSLQK